LRQRIVLIEHGSYGVHKLRSRTIRRFVYFIELHELRCRPVPIGHGIVELHELRCGELPHNDGCFGVIELRRLRSGVLLAILGGIFKLRDMFCGDLLHDGRGQLRGLCSGVLLFGDGRLVVVNVRELPSWHLPAKLWRLELRVVPGRNLFINYWVLPCDLVRELPGRKVPIGKGRVVVLELRSGHVPVGGVVVDLHQLPIGNVLLNKAVS
jgi:hypothetical protein